MSACEIGLKIIQAQDMGFYEKLRVQNRSFFNCFEQNQLVTLTNQVDIIKHYQTFERFTRTQ